MEGQNNENTKTAYEKFNEILSELMDELPQEFFKELHGGVIISERAPLSEYDKAGDLYVFGQYRRSSIGRQITIFKGSFDRMHGDAWMEDQEQKEKLTTHLREVLRHEFRHHMEFMADIHNSESLEREDERAIRAYLGMPGD